MKKISINSRHGGFRLSNKALKRILELKNKNAYFYIYNYNGNNRKYTPISDQEAFESKGYIDVCCFTVPDAHNILIGNFDESSIEERIAYNEKFESIYISPYDHFRRDDEDLIKVIEELGQKECSSEYSEIKIVEIPDDVDWIIQEYDGLEWVAEKHRTWS